MAILDKESLRAAVRSGDITAVCVDTNIYEAQQFAFHKGILGEMKSLPVAGIRVLLPDIIDREVSGHMANKLPEAVSVLRKAMRAASNLGVISDIAEGALGIADTDHAKHASERLDQHKKVVAATQLRVSDFVNLASVLDDYFEVRAPFEPKKRNEFADALVLNSLEAWAMQETTQVVVISDDAGWKMFCENSKVVHAGPSLTDLLVAVQASEPSLLRRAVASISGDALEGICASLSDSIRGMSVHAEASSHHHAETEVVNADVLDIQVDELTSDDLDLVRNDDGEFVVRWMISALVNFEVNVEISVFDSIDRDYVVLGTETVLHEEEMHLDALLTFLYDSGDREAPVEFDDMEVTRKRIEIDLGEVELNFDPEE
ncbi:DUF4935 domain-containing protein [Lysobacter ciconiae]|uniref:DUF4935 domain-containing protein n=1 Tax=Novilysobacter ciconiae TaxID=2781022 RepID=A0A7S6UDV9_9GAMM|nr:PIN domain-containing protein [Lysobacter ciconiae]QOW18462.1 DUF4935 domain-containing protein [Lysobacter ciconiae]